MQIQFVAKKVDGQYEGALIIDHKFARSGKGPTLAITFLSLVSPYLALADVDGSEYSIDIAVAAFPVEDAPQAEAVDKQ